MAESKKTVFDCLYKNGVVEEGIDIKIKKFLSIHEQISFCNCVMEQVFVGSTYVPAIYDFAVRYATLIYFTDIKFANIDDPELSEKLNTALYQSNIIEYITARVNEGQYKSLCDAARRQVDFIVAHSRPSNDLSDVVIDWVNKLGGMIEPMLSNKELLTLAQKFNNVSEKDIVHELVKYIKEPAEK